MRITGILPSARIPDGFGTGLLVLRFSVPLHKPLSAAGKDCSLVRHVVYGEDLPCRWVGYGAGRFLRAGTKVPPDHISRIVRCNNSRWPELPCPAVFWLRASMLTRLRHCGHDSGVMALVACNCPHVPHRR